LGFKQLTAEELAWKKEGKESKAVVSQKMWFLASPGDDNKMTYYTKIGISLRTGRNIEEVTKARGGGNARKGDHLSCRKKLSQGRLGRRPEEN